MLHLQGEGGEYSNAPGLNLCNAQESTEDPSLPVQVVVSDAQHLPLSNHLRGLDSLNNCPRGPLGPRSLHGTQSSLYVPVVGFNSVIAVALGSLAASAMDLALLL